MMGRESGSGGIKRGDRDEETTTTNPIEPVALENGDLELQQKAISIGKLTLPVPLVLKFIQSSYPIPDWVTIQPNEEKVYMELQNMKLKSDLKVRVHEFDLKNNDIEFSLQVPME